eukprot:CAMPEP_0117031716 /NCGR_PEP_ID=MMETSP0472-20121206/22763_1 /TAXON_ID=693140 ORGANISM="Tiarina fusus, Strain LIS" /NCGR_SAMPLE_ID=MMETSP0472 /ASSEMBLY_ACC=CAM_ASM_000603 /LENGTH=139 /DNA_ID=CAMNT_0004740097 /DNA_START=39 /DNA_END=459 /DNA_ORIENTATION=+
MSLFVGQLSHEMHTNELKGIFEEFGRLNRCELKSGSRADFAFLTFEHERDAEDALHSLNGKEFYGLKMNVEWAEEEGPDQADLKDVLSVVNMVTLLEIVLEKGTGIVVPLQEEDIATPEAHQGEGDEVIAGAQAQGNIV